MKQFAFMSRHVPSKEQHEIAATHDIELVHVGDRDGFNITPDEFVDYDGVIVVHSAAAIRL